MICIQATYFVVTNYIDSDSLVERWLLICRFIALIKFGRVMVCIIYPTAPRLPWDSFQVLEVEQDQTTLPLI